MSKIEHNLENNLRVPDDMVRPSNRKTAKRLDSDPVFILPAPFNKSGVATVSVLLFFFITIFVTEWITHSSPLDDQEAERSNPPEAIPQRQTVPQPNDDSTVNTDVNNEKADKKQKSVAPAKPLIERIMQPIKSGEIFVDHLKKRGMETAEIYRIVSTFKGHIDLRRLKAGQEITLLTDRQNQHIKEVIIRTDFDKEAVVTLAESGDHRFDLRDAPFSEENHYQEGEIVTSLFETATQMNIPLDLLYEMTRLYSYDIDFQRDIRKGARFSIYYKSRTSLAYGDTQTGDILYSEFTLHNRDYAIAKFEDKGHFHQDGRSVQKALLKTPIDGARISDGYGMRRHPILGYSTPHKGIDFAARPGTPIRASGDGVIERASRFGTFGHYIRIRHQGGYHTIYAHLKGYARGIKSGKRVKQGDIIGYVGSTGRVTGPHLHYEVLKNKRHINPSTLKMPPRFKLEGEALTRHKTTVESYRNAINRIIASTEK